MKTTQKVAVYLDHFTADVYEYSESTKLVLSIKSEFNAAEKKKSNQKGESHLHHKEQDLQQKFYLLIKHKVINYDAILLFGTTTAKTELLHVLQSDSAFSSKEITIKNTDRLTENQKTAFINDFFLI